MRFGVLCLALVLAAPSSVEAANTRGERAEALKKRAFRHVAEGSPARGIEDLEAAHALVPHPTLLFNIAVVYDQWPGHCTETLAAFERFFAACARCRTRETAEKRFARVQARCQVDVEIRSEPPGAEVRIGKEVVGSTPTKVRLAPGAYGVSVSKTGFESEARSLEVLAGRDRVLDIVLRPEPVAPPPTSPSVSTGPSPSTSQGARPGPWVVGSFVAGGVGAVMGGVFSGLTVDAVDRETELRRSGTATPGAVQSLRSEARTHHALAVTGFSLAAVGAVTGVILFFVEAQSAPVEVTAGPRHIGIKARF